MVDINSGEILEEVDEEIIEKYRVLGKSHGFIQMNFERNFAGVSGDIVEGIPKEISKKITVSTLEQFVKLSFEES